MTISTRLKRFIAWGKKNPWLFAFLFSVAAGIWQWWETNEQNRKNYESSLIAKALELKDRRSVAEQLDLLIKLNLVTPGDYKVITQWAAHPDEIPGFAGAAIRDKLVTYSELKCALKKLHFYSGEVSNTDTVALRRAIARFQTVGLAALPFWKKQPTSDQLVPDGLIGPTTLRALMIALPYDFQDPNSTDCFAN